MTITIVGALLIGITLGLLGSGGSTITVPILVYLVGHDAKVSIAESMAIVGFISVVGAIPFARAKQVDWSSVLLFGIPAMFGTLLGAYLGGLASNSMQLLVFGVVLFLAAGIMIRKAFGKQKEESGSSLEVARSRNLVGYLLIFIEGTIVGVLTGFVGVGGGFLIVPALLILGKLSMRTAIGTSLVIIVMKSTIGFAKYQHYLINHDLAVDWNTIAIFSLIGLLGFAVGKHVNKSLNQRTLMQVFAIFLILVGGYIVAKEGSEILNGSKAESAFSEIETERAQHETRSKPSQYEPETRASEYPSRFTRSSFGLVFGTKHIHRNQNQRGETMKLKTLGKTNEQVSVVGLGTWQFGGEWGVDFTAQQVDSIFDAARDCGINLIDTAECYGDHLSEEFIGAAIESDRDNWFLATKFGHCFHSKYTRSELHSGPDVVKQLEDSLRALRTDRIDLYQYHSWSNDEVYADDVQAALLKAKDDGKIRFLGNSVQTSGDSSVQVAQCSANQMDAIQIVYNRLAREPEDKSFPICEEQVLGVLARVPLASGYLSGKYKPGHHFSDNEVRGKYHEVSDRDKWLSEVEKIKAEEVPDGVDMAQWAIAWCLKHPAVTSVIPGVKNADQVRSNAAASEMQFD